MFAPDSGNSENFKPAANKRSVPCCSPCAAHARLTGTRERTRGHACLCRSRLTGAVTAAIPAEPLTALANVHAALGELRIEDVIGQRRGDRMPRTAPAQSLVGCHLL